MVFTNLDVITRRWLLERGWPIHYYAEGLYHSSAALRELSFDTLKIIRSVILPVNSYYSIDLPSDYVDDLCVAIPLGSTFKPIAKSDNINPIRTRDSTGAFAPYSNSVSNSDLTFFGFNSTWTYWWNVDAFGEFTGRRFGGTGGSPNTYSVVKERNQIQLSNTFTSDSVMLMYVSDGQSADSATQIDTMAQKTIQTYIDWQTSPNRTLKDSGEARTFYNERRRLVSLLDDLTVTDIRAILRRNFMGSPKN